MIFGIPSVKSTLITPKNYNRGILLILQSHTDTLIQTYGETAFILVETVVDVIVSHTPQQQTNKLYMEAMGILLTLFSRMMRNVRVPLILNSRTMWSMLLPLYLPSFPPTSFSTYSSFAPECLYRPLNIMKLPPLPLNIMKLPPLPLNTMKLPPLPFNIMKRPPGPHPSFCPSFAA